METKRPSKQEIAKRDVSRFPHVHSTNRLNADTAPVGQVLGPWKRYQLRIEDGRFILPGNDGENNADTKRSTLDPETRAGCVPATAYPSFRTLPPPPDAAASRRQLQRVSS